MFITYNRVSTSEQAADNRSSLQEQERICRGIAMTRGVQPFDQVTFTDAGISGSIPLSERPAGKELLDSLKPTDIVVAAKLDRMFRSASDCLQTVEMFQARKVDLILANISTDPVTANGVGKFFLTVMAAAAELDKYTVLERMSDGRKGKKQKNGHVGGDAPYGYKVIGSGRDAKLEPHADEQIVVQKVAELWPALKPAEVVRQLTEAGLVARSGQPFHIIQVKRIAQRLPQVSEQCAA